MPVRIGAGDLKDIGFDVVERRWNDFSDGYPLNKDDLILRNNNWAVLSKDADVISAGFLKKGKDNIPKFRTGKCTVFLEVPEKVYTKFEEWRDNKVRPFNQPIFVL